MPLHGSQQGRRVEVRSPHGAGGAVALAVLACLGAGGCGGYLRAEIYPLATRGAENDGAQPLGTTREYAALSLNWQITIDASAGAGREELGLLEAMLAFAGATGKSRLASVALRDFDSSTGEAPTQSRAPPGLRLNILRADLLGDEMWLVNSRWIVRELRNGALLAWEGDFAQVISTISILMPTRSSSGGL